MHYYSFNIGDYARDTGHLTVIEHGIYRLLLDWCYLNEKPITTEQAMRVGRGYPEETQSVLSEFFSQSLEGWTQHRIGLEVEKYHGKARANRENGAKGGRPKPKNNPVGSQSDAKHNPNQEPITKEPITKEEKETRKRVASPDLKPDDVSEKTWADWVDLRKKKKTTVSQTAIDEARRECKKADLTLERFLQIWCLRGSQGLQADWIKPHERGSPAESFKERDARNARARWEEMTGQTHPDSLPKNIIDVIDPQILELSHDKSH